MLQNILLLLQHFVNVLRDEDLFVRERRHKLSKNFFKTKRVVLSVALSYYWHYVLLI